MCGSFALIVLILSSSPASANPDDFGVELGELYLSVDPSDRYATYRSVCADPLSAMTPFTFYLMANVDYSDIGLPSLNESNGIASWEATVHIPAEITVTNRILRPASSSDTGEGAHNWIVETGQTIPAATPFALVEYEAMLLAENLPVVRVALDASEPSRFGAPGGPGLVPGWREFVPSGECPGPCLRAFQGWDRTESGLVINCRLCPPWADCFPEARVVLLRPTGGERWVVGTTKVIEWDTFLGAPVELSTDGGDTWTPIADLVCGTTFEWTVPNAPTTQAQIRVRDGCDYTDVSGEFTITAEVATSRRSWSAVKSLFR